MHGLFRAGTRGNAVPIVTVFKNAFQVIFQPKCTRSQYFAYSISIFPSIIPLGPRSERPGSSKSYERPDAGGVTPKTLPPLVNEVSYAPPTSPHTPLSVNLELLSETKGERRPRVSVARPYDRPTDPSRRSRCADPALERESDKILKDDRRLRFSPSLCHKNENFQTRTSLTVRVYFRLPHLYFSLELYDPHVNEKFSNTPIVPSLAVTSTSPIALCDSHECADTPQRYAISIFSIRATTRTCPDIPARLCQATSLLGPITFCPHTIKDGLKIASSSFRVQHPNQQHGC